MHYSLTCIYVGITSVVLIYTFLASIQRNIALWERAQWLVFLISSAHCFYVLGPRLGNRAEKTKLKQCSLQNA